ncbi:MAG: hypothetical protein ISS47_08955 [Candidatus Omnitrophica bacterium]|nr:hypothetical protein [Candidatus Omnitrophota bacterium]
MLNLNPFAISGLLIAVTCFILIFILFKYGRTKFHQLWALFHLAVGIWGVGIFCIGISTSEGLARIGWKIALFGGPLIAVFCYRTASELCEIRNKKIITFAYLYGIFFSPAFIITDLFHAPMRFAFNSFYYIQFTDIFFHIYSLFWLIFVAFGHYLLFKCYRHSEGLKQYHAFYFLIYMFIGFSGGSLNFLPCYGIDLYPAFNFTIPIAGLMMTYIIFKHQIMNINIVIRKGLVYSTLVAIITAGYLIFVIIIERLFQGLVGYQSFVVNLFAIFAIAILFNPLRDRIQIFLDKRFFKGTLESLTKERQRLQQELFQAEKLAYVGRLASSVAHEIKNPLTAIKTYIEYLPNKYQDNEFKENFQKIIPREINRIEKVLYQLLNLAKPSPLSLKPTKISDIINSTLSLLENNLKLKRINIRKNFLNNEIMILADEEQLRQVFLNLFLNSIQAMDEGGMLEISITNQCSYGSKTALIRVQDNGCGISQENLKKLFTPFFTTKNDGIGLGLIITQEIIKAHKGTISVESKLGEGTKFIIELPLR